MGLKIKLVPHPGRKILTIQDGRELHGCRKCKDDQGQPNKVVKPREHPAWQAVPCDTCGGPCDPISVPLGGAFDKMRGIELEGSIVGLCHAGPNGYISPTQRDVDVTVWQEIKRYIDKAYGGSALLQGYPPTFEEVMPNDEPDDEDDTDTEEDEQG